MEPLKKLAASIASFLCYFEQELIFWRQRDRFQGRTSLELLNGILASRSLIDQVSNHEAIVPMSVKDFVKLLAGYLELQLERLIHYQCTALVFTSFQKLKDVHISLCF